MFWAGFWNKTHREHVAWLKSITKNVQINSVSCCTPAVKSNVPSSSSSHSRHQGLPEGHEATSSNQALIYFSKRGFSQQSLSASRSPSRYFLLPWRRVLCLVVLNGEVGPLLRLLPEAARAGHLQVPAAGVLVEHRVELGVVVGVVAGDGGAAAGLLLGRVLGGGRGVRLPERVEVGLKVVAGGAFFGAGALLLGQERPPPLGPLCRHRWPQEVGCNMEKMLLVIHLVIIRCVPRLQECCWYISVVRS